MKIALVLMCVAQVLDGVLTRWAVSGGIVAEGNPLLAASAGAWGYVLLKLAGAAACAAALWLVHRRFPRMATASATSVTAFYSMVLLWNAGVLARA